MSNKKRIKKRVFDLKKTKRIIGVLLLGNGSVIHLHNIQIAQPKKAKVRSYSYSQQINFWYPNEK